MYQSKADHREYLTMLRANTDRLSAIQGQLQVHQTNESPPTRELCPSSWNYPHNADDLIVKGSTFAAREFSVGRCAHLAAKEWFHCQPENLTESKTVQSQPQHSTMYVHVCTNLRALERTLVPV